MSDNTNRAIIQAFAFGAQRITEQCAGLTHEEGLALTVNNQNCVNWTVGHVVKVRRAVLKFLGDETSIAWSEQDDHAYGDADTVEQAAANAAEGRTLEDLLATLNSSQEKLEELLSQKDIRELEGTRPFRGREIPLYSMVEFMAWHEGTHLGELSVMTEIVRQRSA